MAGFYTARSRPIPPLPWQTFAPPFSGHGTIGAYQGRGSVFYTTGVQRILSQVKIWYLEPGRKYQVRFSAHLSGTGNIRMYAGFQVRDAAGAWLGANSGRVYNTINGTVYPAATGWIDVVSAPFDLAYLEAQKGAGGVGVNLLTLLNYDNNTNATVGIDGIWLEDVTESQSALGSATAASTSASVASTKATEASTSATTATTQANTATTKAGEASTSAGAAATSATNAAGSSTTALEYRNTAARLSSGGVSKNPVFNDWTGTYPANTTVTLGGTTLVNKITTGVRYINAIEMVGNDTGQNRPILSLNKSTHSLDCSTSPKEVLIRLELELMSGTLVGGACLIATWTAGSGGATATVAKMLDAAMDNVTGKVQVVEFYIPRPVTYIAGAAPTFDLTLYAVSNLAGHTRAACTLRVHRFDFEEVLAGSTTSIYQQTVAKTDGISSAVIGMRAAAGSGGALLELVALSDPSGGAVSAARIAADNILLDGSVTARHIEAGSMNADIIGAGVLNARFLEVTERLKISSGTGALSVGKDTAYDLASDGIYFGRTASGGFGFLAGKKTGGVDQYIQATDETGLLTVNAAHYVTGTAASESSVTTSQTVTLPVGTKLLSLNIVGGGKGGRGSSGTATASGGDTTVALWDGATNTGISWTGIGASGTTPADGPGGSSDYGVGGAASTPASGVARPGNPGTGYGAGGSGVSKGNGSGTGTREGGGGAVTTRVVNYNISALVNPKIVVTIGAGSAGSAPAGYNGGDGTNGIVKYSARENDLIMASVIPLAPTYSGTITKAASGKLTFPDYGAGMWCLSAQGTNLLLDYVTTHASGKTVKLTNGNYACFISDITPVDDAVSATAVTYEYQFFKLGNWV